MTDIEKLKKDSKKIREKYPDRIPIIIEKDKKDNSIPNIDKNKYLTPSDLSIGQFMFVIRKRLNLDSNQTIYFFCDNTLIPSSTLICQLDQTKKFEDGFLRIIYAGENSFGTQHT